MSEYTLDQLKKLDYSAVENQSALISAIIEAKGWKTIRLDEPEIAETDIPYSIRIECWYYVVDEKGERRNGFAWQTEELAWEHADNPDWAGDLNAAIALLDEIGEWVNIHWMKLKEGLVYWVGAAVWGNPKKHKVHIEHADLCIACCLAYLEWKQAQVKP